MSCIYCLNDDPQEIRQCDICGDEFCEDHSDEFRGKRVCDLCLDRLTQYRVSTLEAAIGIPAENWKGRCHEISSLMLKHYRPKIEAKLCYGMFVGNIASTGYFGGHPISRHGWLKAKDGMIIDPTRWVFEDVKPYIYYGFDNEEYDFGANEVRRSIRVPFPKLDKERSIPFSELPKAVQAICKPYTKKQKVIGIGQLLWMANLTPVELGKDIKKFYQYLIDTNRGGFVPCDNMKDIMG